jgi:hypothetical protein
MGQTLSADLIARYAISKEWQHHAYYILISLRFKSFALADYAFVLVHCIAAMLLPFLQPIWQSAYFAFVSASVACICWEISSRASALHHI